MDAISRKQLQALTKDLHKEFGMTTIFVTHDTDEALKLGDRIAVLQEGEIRQVADPENPYFYEGKYASGLGSSHTFYRYIWPIALSIQGLTTNDKAEKKFLLDQLVACDGGTGVMHESFHVDDPTKYSREWFSWANMMFCELVLDYLDIR